MARAVEPEAGRDLGGEKRFGFEADVGDRHSVFRFVGVTKLFDPSEVFRHAPRLGRPSDSGRKAASSFTAKSRTAAASSPPSLYRKLNGRPPDAASQASR